MQFGILGALEAGADGRLAELGPPKQRALLAILLLHVGEIVPTDRLIDFLWGADPPRTAAHSVQIYVSDLRKSLEPLAGSRLIATRPPGYQLETAPDSIDARRIRTVRRGWDAQGRCGRPGGRSGIDPLRTRPLARASPV